MFENILRLLRDAVETGAIIFTPHAQDEMNEDELLTFDLEQCVLTRVIIERQWDDSFKDWKYIVEGESADEAPIVVVVKLDQKGKIVFITTYCI